MIRRFIFLVPVLILLSCNNSAEEKKKDEKTTAQMLVGEWNNLSLKIEINSKKNTDTNDVFEVPMGQWEQILRIKPIRTFFRADSTFNSAHYTLTDSLFYDPSGEWWIEGDDKLVWQQQKPNPDRTVYTVKVVNDTASFEGLVDWDGDGNKDDKYFGKQKRVSSSAK